MKNLFLITLSFCLLLSGTNYYSQSIDKEVTFELDKKAKRGKLANVEIDSQGNYKLYYITKTKSKKIKFQIYTFDPNFSFLGKVDDELELEKVKSKYSWFNFKGELYSVVGISLNWNPAMPLKLKKKETSYHYDWLLLGYHKRVKVLEKVKPRTDDGMKYFAKGYFEDDVTGDIYIIVGVAPGLVSKEAGAQYTDLRLIKFDWDLNKVAETKIPFEYGQEVAFAKGFAEPDPENPTAVGFSGGVVVFAPTKVKGLDIPVDENKGNFTFVEFDKDLNIITRESFDNPSPGWTIEDMQWAENSDGKKDIYLYGPAAFGKDKYYLYAKDAAKKKSIQVMKVSSSKVEYLTETTLEDIEAVKTMPADNKKTTDYNGKVKPSFNFTQLSSGNILLYGQYYNEGKPSDYMALEFDNSGKLVANYTRNMETKIKVPFTCVNSVSETSNGVYWISYEAEGDETTKYIVPVITKLDTKAKKVNDPMVLGKDGKKQLYYVDPSYPLLNISQTQQVYFGSDKKGKNIWFCRVNL
ncbi:hypothetical protein [Parvicella tangerina]|nr:hypothetical protein [Parvicella tangerina]